MFVGCSEISISDTVKHVQHAEIVKGSCLPEGTYWIFEGLGSWGLLERDQLFGWDYSLPIKLFNLFKSSIVIVHCRCIHSSIMY